MIRRLIQLTLHPSAAFDEIVRQPDFVPPWLLTVVFFALPMLIATRRMGILRLLGNPQGIEDFVDALAVLFQLMVVVVPAIGIPLTAACLIPMIKAMHGQAAFRPFLAATAYASLPPSIGICFVSFLVMIFRDPSKLTLESLAPLNLGLLVPARFGAAHSVASTIELFSAWSVVLLSHGIAAASGLSFWRVFLALAVPLILFAWILAFLAAML